MRVVLRGLHQIKASNTTSADARSVGEKSRTPTWRGRLRGGDDIWRVGWLRMLFRFWKSRARTRKTQQVDPQDGAHGVFLSYQ